MNHRFLLLVVLFSSPVLAQDLIIDFSKPVAPGAGSTAVANFALHKLHVPFVADRTCDVGTHAVGTACSGSTESDPIDIGDGTDGPLEAATLPNFDISHGATAGVVVLDTSRDYKFTTFDLPAGYSIHGSGTRALVIRVQGDAQVDGTIDVSGGDGAAPAASGGATPSGGTVCCGGLAGGEGGTVASGQAGGSVSNHSGGWGGSSAAAGNGAGGGAGAGSQAGAGQNGSAGTVGGAPGGGGIQGGQHTPTANLYDDYVISFPFTTGLPNFAGSGGGGGGPVVGTAYGAGGGAGGGAILFSAGGNVTIGAAGGFYANGGNGGSGIAGNAGCGGGGSGGSIVIFTGGTLFDGGFIHAVGGNGGTGCGNGGVGGNGAVGVLRWVTSYGDIDPLSPSSRESPASPLIPLGQSQYSLQSVVYTSAPIDTGLSEANFSGVKTDDTPNSGTITYAFAGSNDAFASDDSGFVSSADIAKLSGKRYVRFRVTMQGTSRIQSPEVHAITFQYTVPAFDYRFAGCARIHPRGPMTGGWWMLGFLVYLLTLPYALRSWRLRWCA